MTVVISRGYAWVADRDGVAHAQSARGRATRTLCQIPVIDPRFGHPSRVKCDRCTEVADRPS